MNDAKQEEAEGQRDSCRLVKRPKDALGKTHAAARRSRCEKLGCDGITVSRKHGGVSHIRVACCRLPSYPDNEGKVAVRRIVLGS